MTEPAVSVVLVTYNSQRTIERSLESLRRAHDRGIARTIVVDNVSSDDTIAILDRNQSWATIVKSEDNLGFGRGCNLGARQAESPFLLFLNPDAVMEPDAIAALAGFLDSHERVGVVGPAIREADGALQHAGGIPSPGRIVRGALGMRVAAGVREITPGAEPFQTSWVCGAALMVRRDLFDRLDGFDPRFFLYFEETDLCRRSVQAGSEIWAVGEAVAHHAAGESSRDLSNRHYAGCIAEHYFASRYYYLCKHHGLILGALAEVGEIVALALCGIARKGARQRLARRLRGPILCKPSRVAA